MAVGVLFALVTGMLWGLTFIIPVMLGDYPSLMVVLGRYLAFGFISVILMGVDWRALSRFSMSDWIAALRLGFVGHILYYLLLTISIQEIGTPVPAVIMGAVPITLAVAANILYSERDGKIPWLKLARPLALITIGVLLVNVSEIKAAATPGGGFSWAYALGVALSFAALACWTWFPLRNADWLRSNKGHTPRAWATAQGVVLLPLTIIGGLAFWGWEIWSGQKFEMPFGPRPMMFLALAGVLGILSSWLGAVCWNEASQRLPTTILGQLIVFETLFALLYAFLWRESWPDAWTVLGSALLMAGIVLSVRLKPEPVS